MINTDVQGHKSNNVQVKALALKQSSDNIDG
jgi:hypothetical protein